jgi:guanosine-3',5'-bis(diphosphate) 3'-pyrophosphohydrolase
MADQAHEKAKKHPLRSDLPGLTNLTSDGRSLWERMLYRDIVAKADALAEDIHRGQVRRDKAKTPYITHPRKAAAFLEEAGITSPVLLAVMKTHDCIEDGPPDVRERLLAALGPTVVAGVDWMTDDPNTLGPNRKNKQTRKLMRAPVGVRCVKLGDGAANLQDLAVLPPMKMSAEKQVMKSLGIQSQGASLVAIGGIPNQLAHKFETQALHTIATCASRMDGAERRTTVPLDVEQFLHLAAKAQQTLLSIGWKIAEANNLQAPQGALKSRDRVVEKASCDYKGDLSRVKDAARITFVADTPEQIELTRNALKKEFIVTRVKDRLTSPSREGYRDVLLNVRLNGIEAEILIIPRHVYVAKRKIHCLYSQQRRLAPSEAEAQLLTKKQIAIYQNAYKDFVDGEPTEKTLYAAISTRDEFQKQQAQISLRRYQTPRIRQTTAEVARRSVAVG